MSTRFESLGISPEILAAVSKMGFEEASPIQALAIPPLLEGRDVIGQAQTGTGKTAAFGIPILERIDTSQKVVQCLILCPTRELAIQVAEEIGRLASKMPGTAVVPVYGGQPIERQFRSLSRGAQIVVGTPGRVMDHMERGSLRFDGLRMAVLDEADEMLDMGFYDDIEKILDKTPAACQTIFFSATMPRDILNLARKFLDDPEVVKVVQKELTVPSIDQVYFEVRPYQKMDALCRVLDSQGYQKALVFCSTKRSVDEVTAHLQTRGYSSDALHGDLPQEQRDRVMGRFRTGGVEVLVATDVAARGLDVDNVDAVINYDIPNDVENYVHRIGRTGRAGRLGKAFTFVTMREYYKLRDIIRYTKAKIIKNRLPTLKDVWDIKTTRLLDEVRDTIRAGALEQYAGIVEQFLEDDLNSADMASALLKLLMQREFGEEPLQDKDDLHDSLDVPEREAEGPRGRKSGGKGRPAWEKGRSRAPMTRLFFNVGTKMHVQPKDLVGAIAGESGIAGKNIGAIEMHDSFCFVEVASAVAEEVMSIMNRSQIKGYRVAVDKAVPKK